VRRIAEATGSVTDEPEGEVATVIQGLSPNCWDGIQPHPLTTTIIIMHTIEQYIKFDLPKAPDMRVAALLKEALIESPKIEMEQPLINEVVDMLVPARHINSLTQEEQDDYASTWYECYKSIKSAVFRLAAERWLSLQYT
jgi:hypothetical protein